MPLCVCVSAGENVVRGHRESVKNLLEIFEGLLEYLMEEMSEDSQDGGRHKLCLWGFACVFGVANQPAPATLECVVSWDSAGQNALMKVDQGRRSRRKKQPIIVNQVSLSAHKQQNAA